MELSDPGGIGFGIPDIHDDGVVDIGDAICSLDFLFGSGSAPSCLDALDANDDELLNIADPIFLLGFLFSMGQEPPAPGPDVCGPDPVGVGLNCSSHTNCP